MRFHASLPVRDLEATIGFYRLLFDAEPVKRRSNYVKFLPAEPALNISFHESPEAVEGRIRLHLGLEMPDRTALDRAHERLARTGLISDERETSVCCYANQDKFRATDPSGYQWELYLVLEDTEQRISPDTRCCAGGTASGSCLATDEAR